MKQNTCGRFWKQKLMISITETENVLQLLKKFNDEKSKEMGFRTFDRLTFENFFKNLNNYENLKLK